MVCQKSLKDAAILHGQLIRPQRRGGVLTVGPCWRRRRFGEPQSEGVRSSIRVVGVGVSVCVCGRYGSSRRAER
jgi:hypothetical protein